MKLIGTFVILALLAGCEAAREPLSAETLTAALALPFSLSGTAVLEELPQPVELTVTRGCDGLTVELLAPPTVAGLKVEFLEEATQVTYRELVMKLAPEDIPQQSLFVALADLLAALPQPGATLSRRGGSLLVSGKAGLNPYELLWSTDGKMLEKIGIPVAGAVITVTNFQAVP